MCKSCKKKKKNISSVNFVFKLAFENWDLSVPEKKVIFHQVCERSLQKQQQSPPSKYRREDLLSRPKGVLLRNNTTTIRSTAKGRNQNKKDVCSRLYRKILFRKIPCTQKLYSRVWEFFSKHRYRKFATDTSHLLPFTKFVFEMNFSQQNSQASPKTRLFSLLRKPFLNERKRSPNKKKCNKYQTPT